MLFALVVTFCTVWSNEGFPKPKQEISVTVDTGWSIEGDMWVWGYAAVLKPPGDSGGPLQVKIPLERQRLQLCKSQVRAHMEYCCHLWTEAPGYQLEPLNSVQRLAARIVDDPNLASNLGPLSLSDNVTSDIGVQDVWSIEGNPRPRQNVSVTIDTGWSIEGDRWAWGYADVLSPPKLSSDTAQVSGVEIKSHSYQNKTDATTSPSITEESQQSPLLNFSRPTPPTPQVSTDTAKINTQNNENKTGDKTASPTKKSSSGTGNSRVTENQKLLEIIGNNATIAKMFNDVCLYNSSLPDFNTPGRRISDVKCQEYIWNIKNDIEKERKRVQCGWLKYQLTDKTSYIATTIGGRITAPGEFPHMGAIGWKGVNGEWQFKCGSSLISPNFVLTAAHCSRARDTDSIVADLVPKIVRLSYKNIVHGLPSKTLGEFDLNIINIINHPEYVSPKQYYDVALMELERTVQFTQYVQPSCLWGYSEINKLGSIATLTGWGVLAEGSLDISPELQAAVLDIIDSDKCSQYLRAWQNRNWRGVSDHQLCAGKLAGGVDACQGDSGGPLQVKIPLEFETSYNMYYVIGVTSFGVGCAQPNLPGVYSRVSSFIDWIESVVWPQ